MAVSSTWSAVHGLRKPASITGIRWSITTAEAAMVSQTRRPVWAASVHIRHQAAIGVGIGHIPRTVRRERLQRMSPTPSRRFTPCRAIVA
ncbi:hypothetical protein [Sphingomonas hankookensis]|uniref:hypothetical protein n=1 Tax=Sphingomonas hankookensis TaxID=563996 RepID=UPI003D301C58